MIRVLRTGLLMACLAATTACTHLTGERLSDGVAPAVRPKAIPFPLMRPRYTLALVPPADDTSVARYTINVTYEPDPTQWYSLKLNPAFLSDPGFKLFFNTNGSLKTVNATTTEQITPTIKAVGSFAASIIGAAATGAFKTADPRDSIVLDIQNAGGPCTATWDYTIPAGLYPSANDAAHPNRTLDAKSTVGEALTARMRGYGDKGEDTFETKIHYATPGELACFAAAQKVSKGLTDTALAKAQADYDALKKSYLQIPGSDAVFLAKVDAAIEAIDPDLLDVQKAAVKTLPAAIRKPADALQVAAAAVIAAKSEQTGGAILKTVVEMPGPAWRARHVVFLEDELDRISLIEAHALRLSPADIAALQAYRRTLYAARALTVNAVELERRAAPLRAFLATAPTKPEAHGPAPAAKDYAVIRLELDELDKRIQTKRDAVVAAGDPPKPKKPSALTDAPLAIITLADIDTSHQAGWDGASQPAYALLLTDPSSPPPPAKEKAK
jgi:hypothetical protein